jgi:ribosomal protein L37AE/L43A
MKEMEAIYKCRMCGKEFAKGNVSQEKITPIMVSFRMSGDYGIKVRSKYDEPNVTKYNSHICSDGSAGFADFIGFREEE